MVHKVSEVSEALPEHLARRAQPGRKVHREPKAHAALKALQALLDLKALQARRGR